MKRTQTCVCLGLLGLFTACGGGSGGDTKPTPATRIAYTDPTSGDFRLLKDPSSTPDRLVLALVGPASLSGRGIEFTFDINASQGHCVKIQDGDPEYLRNGDVFQLDTQPRLMKGIYTSGHLNAVVAQRGMAKPLGGVLVRFAVQLKAGANLNVGTPITCSVSEVSYLPASEAPQSVLARNIGLGTFTAQ